MGSEMCIRDIIDITLSLNIPLMISGWSVDRSYNGSDHNTINFSLGREKIVEEAHRPWYKADWGVFQELLRNEVFNIPVNITDKKLDKMLGIFYRKIKKGTRQSMSNDREAHEGCK